MDKLCGMSAKHYGELERGDVGVTLTRILNPGSSFPVSRFLFLFLIPTQEDAR
jgi:hypothetical protein